MKMGIKDTEYDFGSWNVKGMEGMSCREQVVYEMKKRKLKIMIGSEANVNQNSKEEHADHTFYFSTSVTEEQRTKADEWRRKMREKLEKRGRSKGRGREKDSR